MRCFCSANMKHWLYSLPLVYPLKIKQVLVILRSQSFPVLMQKNSGGIIGPRKSRSQLFSVFLFVGIYQTKQNPKQPASWTHTNLKHQHILLFNRWVLSEDQIQVLLTELSGLPQVLIENFLPFTPQQLKVLLVFLVINTVETGKMIGNSITWHNSMESDHSSHFDLAL